MQSIAKKFTSLETIFEIAQLKQHIRDVESDISQDSFWQDNPGAQSIFIELNRKKEALANYEKVLTVAEDIAAYLDLFEQEKHEPDNDTLEEIKGMLGELRSKVDALETQSLLSGKYDQADCIFSINAGAGGVDAQDWASMLVRMYLRWMEKSGYTYEVVDSTLGEEAGIKSTTVLVHGSYAYGYLKNEIGIHRLVRISPFNANGKRQTSFAAVDVIPEIPKDFLDIEIDLRDLKVDTYRASGAGGQHVNKTDSAVRITHLPTGIVSTSQNERSQIANRETAMVILKSRLVQRMEEEHASKISEIRGVSKSIAWGNQIRSYVFHPYSMVKDHRTDYETSDVSGVMDGELNIFIKSMLQSKIEKKSES